MILFSSRAAGLCFLNFALISSSAFRPDGCAALSAVLAQNREPAASALDYMPILAGRSRIPSSFRANIIGDNTQTLGTEAMELVFACSLPGLFVADERVAWLKWTFLPWRGRVGFIGMGSTPRHCPHGLRQPSWAGLLLRMSGPISRPRGRSEAANDHCRVDAQVQRTLPLPSENARGYHPVQVDATRCGWWCPAMHTHARTHTHARAHTQTPW